MSRTERLMDLLQSLRRRSRAVSAQTLADELGVNVRTIYRDILTLQGQGAPIDGEAGVGYILRSGFTLPPLMFTPEEIAALVLGARWVASRADPGLSLAARNSLAKISAVLTPQLRTELETSTLLVVPPRHKPTSNDFAGLIRQAIRQNIKLEIAYTDPDGSATQRTIWPFAIGFFDHVQVLVAWCELRTDFRHFRLDRIQQCTFTGESTPENQGSLLARWQIQQGIPQGAFDLS